MRHRRTCVKTQEASHDSVPMVGLSPPGHGLGQMIRKAPWHGREDAGLKKDLKSREVAPSKPVALDRR